MAEFESPSEFDDELLSAYLDDELSAEERARVEERLAVDPAAAQLLDELRAVSGAVRALPREKLSRDLRASVLAGVARGGLKDEAEPHVVKLPYAGDDRWAGVRRGLVWSSIAIAATLLLMAVQPAEQEEGAVAAKRENERRRELRSVEDVPAFRAPAAEDKEAAGALGGRGGGVDEKAESASAQTAEDEQFGQTPHGGVVAKDGEAESDDFAKNIETQAAGEARQAPAGNEPAESATSGLASQPASGATRSFGGEAGRVDSLAGGAAADQPAAMLDAKKKELADGSSLQIVELSLGEAGAGDAKEFERVLAANRVALNEDALSPQASPDDAAAEKTLTAADSILVEATPAQLKQILTGYRGRAVAVGRARMPEDLSRLIRQEAAADASAAVPRDELRALADWASRAVDVAQTGREERRAGSGAEAWRLLSGAEGQKYRWAEPPVRVAAGAPATTSAAPAAGSAENLSDAAPTADSRQSTTSATGQDRAKAALGADEEPRVRVLFLFRAAPKPAPAAPSQE